MRVKLDIPLTLEEIRVALNPENDNSDHCEGTINAICTDSRECEVNDLFVALNGMNHNGANYVKDALAKKCYTLSDQKGVGTLYSDNTENALLTIATLYKSKLRLKCTVAVTGSVGKTTTVRFISKILSQRYRVHSTRLNYNNHIGVPLTLLSAPKDSEILVLELGMNHKNEISRLSKCIEPDIGIITNIGTSHIGNLGSRCTIAKAKLELKDGMEDGRLLLPANEPLLKEIESAFYVGTDPSASDFSLKANNRGGLAFISPFVTYEHLPPLCAPQVFLPNLSFALSVGVLLELSEKEIALGISSITSSDLRQRFIELKSFTIYDDSYNASLESIDASLRYLGTFASVIGAFLGDVLELGEYSSMIHEEIGRLAAKHNVKHLYLIGKYSTSIMKGAVSEGMNEADIFINTDISDIGVSINQILTNHSKNEVILFKASHKLRLDLIADKIAEERTNNER